MWDWTRESGTDKERERRDAAGAKKNEETNGEEGMKKCWCRAVLSGHILYIFLISLYGPLVQIELLQEMEMG